MTIKAEFSQSRNDMYWKIYDADDGFVRWIGYDDEFWWDNVANSEHAKTRKGEKTGRTFTIDFATSKVNVST